MKSNLIYKLECAIKMPAIFDWQNYGHNLLIEALAEINRLNKKLEQTSDNLYPNGGEID